MRYLAVLCVILTSTLCFRTVAGNGRCRPKIRENTCVCKSNTAGVLRRDGGKLLMCDGSQWKALQFEEPLGSNSKPGYSCKDIMDNGGQTADGAYWMTLTDSRRDAFPVYCDMASAGGGWTMVFKAATGASQTAKDAYKSDDTYAESDMAALDVTSQNPDIYKNRIVLQWTDFRPTEARVVLYEGSNAVKELKFNAQGSDKMNWFQLDKLTQVTPLWTDLRTASQNYFTIDASFDRSFFINSVYGGCPNDVGWMAITGLSSAECDWEKHHAPHAVVYSNQTERTNWNKYNTVGVADTLVVFLR